MLYEPPSDLYQRVAPILQEKLSTGKLKEQLIETENLMYEVSYTRCQWAEKLTKEKERMRIPKENGLTDLDRKSMQDSAVSKVERDYKFLLALEEIIRQRLTLGGLLLH